MFHHISKALINPTVLLETGGQELNILTTKFMSHTINTQVLSLRFIVYSDFWTSAQQHLVKNLHWENGSNILFTKVIYSIAGV